MVVKWVLHWQPSAGAQVTSQTLVDLFRSIESMNGVRTGRWQITAAQHRPFTRDQAMAIDCAKELLGVAFSEFASKHYFVLRAERMVVEADSSIQAIMEKLQVYRNRLSMVFEGFQYQLGDFQLKAGRAVLSQAENLRGIVLEFAQVEYSPVSSIEKTRQMMQEFVDLWQEAISAQSMSGRISLLEPNFAEYALSDTYTWQHTALQYIFLFAYFLSQSQRA
ncbi:mediator of RNA polymerase II transcription subunit 20a isoform X1 [Selaginella moellendorffii]|uniref:mediator of RNA polymerase II transcription subunit 20a isoform X1 n=1 Tax=Selaginella moellendorffii TaxID=88036 RepID=UPI000D1CB550|nr:mediator of RNA polymerase II transcription subunit 20a isoform X1 [Selaginella moellendorffii]XP_024538211.1 mediator of RNA polymerase II transcription subunit 20a isoform X1 [Selaginella moellendorffii]|eukprot:XP_024535707.1 mediator of RNA polymerase II transcription subunit 20a isoform X1 [Selaginella moellendorffii]